MRSKPLSNACTLVTIVTAIGSTLGPSNSACPEDLEQDPWNGPVLPDVWAIKNKDQRLNVCLGYRAANGQLGKLSEIKGEKRAGPKLGGSVCWAWIEPGLMHCNETKENEAGILLETVSVSVGVMAYLKGGWQPLYQKASGEENALTLKPLP